VRLRIFVEPQQGATFADQLAVAQAAEAGGFDAFFRSDHLARIGPGEAGPGPTDTWVTLGAIATHTERIRLGTMVTSATFRLPGPLAVAVAQVDEMSGGRVELGIGTGWYEDEHRAYGIPFPPLGERYERLEEQLEIITGLWATPPGETFSFPGRHYQLTGSPALPKPVQRPRPPIIIGGSGRRRTPALAAAYADEFNVPFHPPEAVGEVFDAVRAAREKAGRGEASLRLGVALTVCCAPDAATRNRRAEAIEQRLPGIGGSLDALRANGLAGTPDEVVERLGAYRELGAEVAYLQVVDMSDLDHIALLGKEVLPRVATW
jgi:F420-dependent oxidoreductase-like protein